MKEFKRVFHFYNKNGEKQTQICTYYLHYNNGILSNVVNQNGYTVEKNSECFEFFSNIE